MWRERELNIKKRVMQNSWFRPHQFPNSIQSQPQPHLIKTRLFSDMNLIE